MNPPRFTVTHPYHGETYSLWYVYDTHDDFAIDSARSKGAAEEIAGGLNRRHDTENASYDRADLVDAPNDWTGGDW
jgi:hypothetical protein